MTTYTPDAWVILRIEAGEEVIHKVMGGWYGGYLHGDSWRLNSGITKVERDGHDHYNIHGYSGSIYRVDRHTQKTTMLMSQIIEQLRERNASVQIVDVAEVLK